MIEAAYDAVTYLISKGHKKLLILEVRICRRRSIVLGIKSVRRQ
jgi:DNA-binding LacI/PurR family transcriptional regulator